MFLVNVLAAASVIGIVHSAPASTYRRREPQLTDRAGMMLFNQIHGLEDADLFELDPGRSARIARTKRLGSLSIVNPLDVLRERVLLELARRKMRQNQRQVDANRRLLQTIGKRAIPNTYENGMDSNEGPAPTDFASSSKAKDYLFAYRFPASDLDEGHTDEQQQQQQQEQFTSSRGTERQQVWVNHGEDTALQEAENDQTQRMANELNLL